MPRGGMQCHAPSDAWTAGYWAKAALRPPVHSARPVRCRAPRAGARAIGLAGKTCRPAVRKTIVRRAMRAKCWR